MRRLVKSRFAIHNNRMDSVRRKKKPTGWESLNRDVISCQRCPRLRQYCEKIAREKRRAFADWEYWGRPVPNFGDPAARVLVVGLAPAAHGGNRTGRVFTGDRSGDWLFRRYTKRASPINRIAFPRMMVCN